MKQVSAGHINSVTDARNRERKEENMLRNTVKLAAA